MNQQIPVFYLNNNTTFSAAKFIWLLLRYEMLVVSTFDDVGCVRRRLDFLIEVFEHKLQRSLPRPDVLSDCEVGGVLGGVDIVGAIDFDELYARDLFYKKLCRLEGNGIDPSKYRKNNNAQHNKESIKYGYHSESGKTGFKLKKTQHNEITSQDHNQPDTTIFEPSSPTDNLAQQKRFEKNNENESLNLKINITGKDGRKFIAIYKNDEPQELIEGWNAIRNNDLDQTTNIIIRLNINCLHEILKSENITDTIKQELIRGRLLITSDSPINTQKILKLFGEIILPSCG
ncbi:MAG: hypothetical protein LBQ66_15845 [Planctomycetaceae bacterium]|jgi:hypothetical protein|nr:hypothetical protein [Planctomycetaceae bacterium]